MESYNEDLARIEAEEKKEYDKLLDAITSVVDTEQGKEVMWHILSQCGIYDNAYTGDNTTFFNLGRREIGLMLIGLMHDADATMYAKLQLWKAKNGG